MATCLCSSSRKKRSKRKKVAISPLMTADTSAPRLPHVQLDATPVSPRRMLLDKYREQILGNKDELLKIVERHRASRRRT